MKLIKKELKKRNKEVIETMEDDENLYGTFLKDNLNYVGRIYKIFYTEKKCKISI
jgi:hypothetical protein